MDIKLGEYINGKPYMKSDFIAVDKMVGSNFTFGPKLEKPFSGNKRIYTEIIERDGVKIRLEYYKVIRNFSTKPTDHVYFSRV